MILLPPDTDTLSDFIKGRNHHIVMMGSLYLQQYGHFTFFGRHPLRNLEGSEGKKSVRSDDHFPEALPTKSCPTYHD